MVPCKIISMLKRNCINCGTEFMTYESVNKVACSKSCGAKVRQRPESTLVAVECQTCGKGFKTKPSRLAVGKGKYCSRACTPNPLAKTGPESVNWKGGKVECECAHCHKTFQVYPSVLARKDSERAMYCSKSCAASVQVGVDAKRWEGGPVERECERCGKSFSYQRSMVEKGLGRFCSKSCAKWIHGRSQMTEYGLERARVRRERIFAQGGSYTKEDIALLYEVQKGICIYCEEALDGKYEIDHKIPVARGGSSWPENLQLLCRPCNRRKSDFTHEEYEERLKRA